jgi:hypothetical protein
LLLTPQESAAPALIELKVPVGGVARPALPTGPLSPQQAAVPSVLMAQVWLYPALTAVNVPCGAVVRPEPPLPQQAMVPPSFLRAQVWVSPALTAVKSPAGGADWPAPFEPQQAMPPVLLTAHECAPPASTCTRRSALAGAAHTSISPTTSAPTALRRCRLIPASSLDALGCDDVRKAQMRDMPTRVT